MTFKVLGQSAPGATTLTACYTVPVSKSAVLSSIVVCNRGAAGGTFRLAVQPGGVAIANKHYLCYDTAIAANDTVVFTIGVTLAATDVVSVYGSSADMSFNIFGNEA